MEIRTFGNEFKVSAVKDAPTYVCVGTNDSIASWRTMQSRLETLDSYGIPTEFHAYEGLSHGFGLGIGTVADGWINGAKSKEDLFCKTYY